MTATKSARISIGHIANGNGRGTSRIYRGNTKNGVRFWRFDSSQYRMFPISEAEVMARLIPSEVNS